MDSYVGGNAIDHETLDLERHKREFLRLMNDCKRAIGEEPLQAAQASSLLQAVKAGHIHFASVEDESLVGLCSVCETYSTLTAPFRACLRISA